MLGEYGASASDVVAETIWLSPEVANDNQPFGGGDGVGGYVPLALATGSGSSATLTWVHGNHLGVPIAFTDASGTAVPPPSYTAPGFPGQTKTLSDLYYNRYRDYDSSTGRYIQADPIGLEGGGNPFGYANDNPLRFTDPSGQSPLLWAMALGAAYEIGYQLGENLVNGRQLWCLDFTEVAGSAAGWGAGFELGASFAGGLVGRAAAAARAAEGGASIADELASAADRAARSIGPGKGPWHGTRVHTAFAGEVEALGDSSLNTEVSYRNGELVNRGTRGSVRLDVVHGDRNAPTTIFDLKTGRSALTARRIQQIRSHLPAGADIPILEIRP